MNRFAFVVLCSCTAALAAQEPPPRFEVASIKPNMSGGDEDSALAPSGRVVVRNMTLEVLIRGVFELQRHQLILGDRVPIWFVTDRWDITALGPPRGDEATERRIRSMMQNLVIDRFKLVTRREVRDTPVYGLVVAGSDRSLGPQLRPSSADCAAMLAAFKATGATRQTPHSKVCGLKASTGRLWGTGVPLEEFIRRLTLVAGRPVLDTTGLTGPVDLDLRWTPDDAKGPATGASLFTAVQEQLGLRLEPRSAPVNVMVIDSVERPTPD